MAMENGHIQEENHQQTGDFPLGYLTFRGHHMIASTPPSWRFNQVQPSGHVTNPLKRTV
jgi:hypothetical protein